MQKKRQKDKNAAKQQIDAIKQGNAEIITE
jgi:hypothetical protein